MGLDVSGGLRAAPSSVLVSMGSSLSAIFNSSRVFHNVRMRNRNMRIKDLQFLLYRWNSSWCKKIKRSCLWI